MCLKKTCFDISALQSQCETVRGALLCIIRLGAHMLLRMECDAYEH